MHSFALKRILGAMKKKIHDMIFTRKTRSHLSWNKSDGYDLFYQILSLRRSNSQFHDFKRDENFKYKFDARDVHEDESTEEDYWM